jgi:hypothetical protein
MFTFVRRTLIPHIRLETKPLRSIDPAVALIAIALGWFGMTPVARAATFSNTSALATARHFHTATTLSNGEVLAAGGNNVSTAERYNPLTGVWSATGNLLTNRYHHTATLLQNGKVLVTGGQGLSGVNQLVVYYRSSEIYDPATGVWTATGSLNSARTDHTATLLNNGKVLVIGGRGSANDLASAEIYDPATGIWTQLTSTLSRIRSTHTATLLANGKVLVTGASGFPSPPAAEIFDPATNLFSLTGIPIVGRVNHTATLLPDGKVLVSGGQASGVTQTSAEIFNPTTGTWTATGSMATGRYSHRAALLPNGKVLAAGGFGSSAVGSAEIFDPATGTWSPAGTLVTARTAHTLTILFNGRLLIAGGWAVSREVASAEICDWASGTWTATTGALTFARYKHTQTLLPNGKVLVAGGLNSGSNPTIAELFDTTSGTWTSTGAMGNGRSDHTATLLPNGKVLVAGGFSNSINGKLPNAELYDPATGAWTATGSLAYKRSQHTATLLPNGKVLVAGGGEFQSLEEIYDPATGTWTAVGAMSTLRTAATATLLSNGKVLVTAGSRGADQASADLFDPVTNTWAATGSLVTARSGHGAALLPNGKVLVTGGGKLNAELISTEIYDPALGTWSAGPAMATKRSQHVTLPLMDGRVLVIGGYGNSSVLNSAEIYDPVNGTWSAGPSMASIRWFHTAVRLPSGTILVAAGNAGSSNYKSCELYNPGLGYSASWQPTVSTGLSSPVEIGMTLSISGARFRGISEGSSGNQQSSAANHPVLVLSSLANGQTKTLSATSWSTTSLVTGKISGLHPGWAYATIVVNGITSVSKLLLIAPSSNANLSSLALSNGTLSPSFDSATTNYFTSVPYSASTLTVTPNVDDSAATVKIRINSGSFVASTPGNTSQPLSLNNGSNSLDVLVTAANGTTTKTYAINITRNFPQILVKNGSTTLVDGSPGSVEFGQIATGTGGTVTFTVHNPGSDNLVLGVIGKDGTHATEFVVGTPSSTTIAPTESATFTVTLNPASSGVKTAAIHLANNLVGSANPFDINLQGTGNTPPTFPGYSFSTSYQTATTVLLAKLLAKATDADGDTVSVTTVGPASAQGGAAVLNATGIRYTPPAAFSGTDTFSVTLTDSRGATANGTVTVAVGPSPTVGGMTANPPKITPLSGGRMELKFQGIPGRIYQIQRSTDMSTWATLSTVAANQFGALTFTDEAPPQPGAFYRLALP